MEAAEKIHERDPAMKLANGRDEDKYDKGSEKKKEMKIDEKHDSNDENKDNWYREGTQ